MVSQLLEILGEEVDSYQITLFSLLCRTLFSDPDHNNHHFTLTKPPARLGQSLTGALIPERG